MQLLQYFHYFECVPYICFWKLSIVQFGKYLHFRQVLHASGDLPCKGDQVTHGERSVVWVLQIAGVSVGVSAHVARANFPTVTQEVAQRPKLGVLHDQIQRTYSEKSST